jgi:hypothetical protein
LNKLRKFKKLNFFKIYKRYESLDFCGIDNCPRTTICPRTIVHKFPRLSTKFFEFLKLIFTVINQNCPRNFEIVYEIYFFSKNCPRIPNFGDNREIVRGQSLSMDNCPRKSQDPTIFFLDTIAKYWTKMRCKLGVYNTSHSNSLDVLFREHPRSYSFAKIIRKFNNYLHFREWSFMMFVLVSWTFI